MSHAYRPLTVILVGLGRVALKHLKAMKHHKDRFTLIAAVDPNTAHGRQTLQSSGFGGVQLFGDFADVPADLTPDIVAITTPSGTHFALARAAILRGCHVLIEKPMTLDLREAQTLLDLADAHSTQIAVGHIYRFFPLVDRIQQAIAAGDWGTVHHASVTVHWGHDQAYYDQAAWRGTWAADGGVLMNQTVHALDLMLWLLGQTPVRASGVVARLAHEMEAEDFGAAVLTLSGGAILRVEGSTVTPEREHLAEFAIVASKGTLTAGIRKGRPYFRFTDATGRTVRPGYIRDTWRALRRGPGVIKGLRDYLNPHGGIYRDLADAITAGRPPRADGRAGYDSVAAILSIYRSAQSGGCPVPYPPTDAAITEMSGHFDANT